MTISVIRFALKNIIHFRRQYGGVFWGSVLAVSLISGSLSTGDSVRYSLLKQTENRLGRITDLLQSQEFFFTDKLAFRIQSATGRICVPVLMLSGTVSSRSTGLSVPGVRICGIPGGYEMLFPKQLTDARTSAQSFISGNASWARANTRLASRLGMNEGDTGEILVRVEKTDNIPGDVPLAKADEISVPVTVNFKGIMHDQEGGAFSLRPHQVMPLTLFVDKQMLENALELEGKSNLVLFGATPGDRDGAGVFSNGSLEKTVSGVLSLEDLGIRLQTAYAVTELSMERIFIHPAIEKAVRDAQFPFQKRLTYFANDISVDGKHTPYSFITGTEEVQIKPSMAIANSWLADDLGLTIGSRVNLTYFYPETNGSLSETDAQLDIADIVSVDMPLFSEKLTPDFPGLTDAANCRDWDAGIPIDFSRIRPRDEAYWNVYRAMPKLLISYRDAKRIFGNRFGDSTSLVFPGNADTDLLESGILKNLDAPQLGITVLPAREQGISSAAGSTDFGGLFAGMSMFIIAAALLLCTLLFSFMQDGRRAETALFFSTGFPKAGLAHIRLVECFLVSFAACFTGMIAGCPVAMAIIAGLSTIWQGAVGETILFFHTTLFSLAGSFIAGLFATMASLSIALARDFMKNPALLFSLQGNSAAGLRIRRIVWRFALSAALILSGIMLLIFLGKSSFMAGVFFASGALLFAGMIASCDTILVLLSRRNSGIHRSVFRLAASNLVRRKNRSLAAIILLASGLFVVISVGANRTEIPDGSQKSSGTGGYDFYARLSMPISGDASDARLSRLFGLQGSMMENTSFAAIRAAEGDDASCLNLNRPVDPSILGIKPGLFASRGSFSFAQTIFPGKTENPWLLLDLDFPDNAIPAVADQTVITWILGKSIGDRITIRAGDGESMDLVLVAGLENSLFQGSILVSDKNFTRLFPSHSGFSLLLVDSPDSPPQDQFRSIDLAKDFFQERLAGFGAEVMTTQNRLALFNEVENTYLLIFLALGGLGILLGCVGFGLVLLKTMNERAAEIAMMQATGFTRLALRKMLFLEHILLLIAGMLCGFIPAVVALVPTVQNGLQGIPWIETVLLAILVALLSCAFMTVITIAVTRREILPVLKTE